MPAYSYELQDLVTGRTLGTLPLSCTGLPRNISADAAATFTCSLGDPKVRALDPVGLTRPGRTAIFALRDDVPVWGGIIWGRDYRQGQGLLTLNCSTVESYWRHRYWALPRTFTNVDRASIFAGMILGWRPVAEHGDYILSDGSVVAGGTFHNGTQVDSDGSVVMVNAIPANIESGFTWDPDAGAAGVVDAHIPGSGIIASLAYPRGKNVYDAIGELAATDPGFEWTCDPARLSDGRLGWKLRYAEPALGRDIDTTGVKYEFFQGMWDSTSGRYLPGAGSNLLDYTYSEDATPAADRSIVLGQEANGTVPYKIVGRLGDLAQGYPLLEISPTYSDAADQRTVDAHSLSDLANAQLPITLPTWTVKADGDFGYGYLNLGDQAEFAVSDLLTPQQADGLPGRMSVERVVAWTVVPEERGQREAWQLTTNVITQPSARLPKNEQRRLDRLGRQVKALAARSTVALTKTYGWVANQTNVLIPYPTATTDGADAFITQISFVKQGDWLTLYLSGLNNASLNGTLLEMAFAVNLFAPDAGFTVPSAVAYNATGASAANDWWFQFPLDRWNYGDVVTCEVHGHLLARNPPPNQGGFNLRINYILSGLPYHN